MKVFVYSVYDEKASAYAPPFFVQKDALALRAFEDEVNNERSRINVHSADYSLYRIGSFDDESGVLTGVTPVFMVKGSSVLKEKLPVG